METVEWVYAGFLRRPREGSVLMCLGIPGELVDVRDEDGLRTGRVKFAGITRDVCLDYVPDAEPGEYVLVHVGFAISKIDREEAARSYRILEELGQTDELTADQQPLDDGGKGESAVYETPEASGKDLEKPG